MLAPFSRMVGGIEIPVHDLAEKHRMFQEEFGKPTLPVVCRMLSAVMRDHPEYIQRDIFAVLPAELQQAILGRPTLVREPATPKGVTPGLARVGGVDLGTSSRGGGPEWFHCTRRRS